MLLDFACRLDDAGQDTVTVASALQWATESRAASPGHWRARLGIVRGFARHMHALDPATEVPPADLIIAPQHRKPPYIYSGEEVSALVHAAGTITAPLATPITVHEHDDSHPETLLWAALSVAPDEGVSVPDLIAQTGMSRRWIYYRLHQLAADGLVTQTARGLWRARRDHD